MNFPKLRQRVKKIIFWGIALTPLLVFAQAPSIEGFIRTLQGIVGNVVPFLIVLASVVFIWGIVTFIGAAGDVEKRIVGRKRIVWGLVGLFVMIAFWGVVTLIANSLMLPDMPPDLEIPANADFLNKIIAEILNPFIALMFALASAVFIWGIIGFIAGAENEEKRTKGKKHIVWGIVGMFIMIAAWGIIALLRDFWESI